ncbi:MAG: TRAP transporter small permease [Pseudomonadota bacterium]
MSILVKIIQWINTICAVVSECLVFLLMLLVTAEIVARHVLNSPIPGQVEAATLSLILILYLGIAYTQWEGSHIKVDILMSRINGTSRKALEVVILCLCLIPSALIAWATTQKAWSSFTGQESITGVINFPVWPGRCTVSFGFILLSLTLIVQILQHSAALFRTGKMDKKNHE